MYLVKIPCDSKNPEDDQQFDWEFGEREYMDKI